MGNRRSQTLDERLVDGFLQYEYTETWQVTASGIAASLLDADLPLIGQPYYITGVTNPVYCYSRRPVRRSDTQAKNTFDVVCTFTNATQRYDRTETGLPADTPEQIVPRVDVAFEEYNETSCTAQFIGIFDATFPTTFVDPGLSAAVPPYLPTPQFGTNVMITNSAKDPIQNINKRKHAKRITYWTYHRDWNSGWDDYLDTVNGSSVTISQRDQDGLRLQYTFPAYQLLIMDIIKEDHWRDGKLWFRRGIVFSHKPNTWFSEYFDMGFNEMYFAGQLNPDSSTITESNMDSYFGTNHADYEQVPVTVLRPADSGVAGMDLQQVAIADPVALNGYGRQLKVPTPDGQAYEPRKLVYMPYDITDFSSLGIS
jgi:hypothetical protein